MKIELTSLNISYTGGQIETVTVYFSAENEGSNLYLSGNIPISYEDYRGNESIDKLIEIIRHYIISEVSVQKEPTEAPE